MAFRNGWLTSKGDAVAIAAFALSLVLAGLLNGYSERVLAGWRFSAHCDWSEKNGRACDPVEWGCSTPKPLAKDQGA